MRIGILTQALHGNYGGILQNYALQQVLKQMGHTPVTIDRHRPTNDNVVKNIAKRLLQIAHGKYESSLLTHSQKQYLYSRPIEFVTAHIDRLGPLTTQSAFDNVVSDASFDAFIVGSDQCWRPCYSPNIADYFLDFADRRQVKRIAYAVSFGVDSWEYTPQQTQTVKKAAANLDAVSVREKSGIKLCQEFLDINAEWVLDPTMLLGVDGFTPYVKKEDTATPFITQYLLEDSPEADAVVSRVKSLTGINECRDNNRTKTFNRFTLLKHYSAISVEEWISNIANARFLVTDSFHGAVFAIMFNIPFIVKLNGTRGNTRIESLLSDFGLEQCICRDTARFALPTIDYQAVNRHLADRLIESQTFLINALS